MRGSSSCPAPSQYQQLVNGQLPPDASAPLLDHLEQCEACAVVVGEQAESDTLIELIRAARTVPSTDPPAVARLVETLSRLRPDSAPSPAALRASPTMIHENQRQVPPECLELLAPAQNADELGRLGPYRILEVVGMGGMGVVFRAHDPSLERIVALKVMLPALAARASSRQRFVREARATASIQYEHIVSVYQVNEERGIPYLAMEFLEGETLETRLERDRKLSVAEAARIGREIALGLSAAHQRGLIHRDITPANIWLEMKDEGMERMQKKPEGADVDSSFSDSSFILHPSSFPRVKILDFGLVRAAGEAQLTQEGALVGTPAYMAPEQAQGLAVDHRCDLFSLGCVLYRMTTGISPFARADVISTLLAVATDQPTPPHELDGTLPPNLSEFILKLLAKNPAERPTSAQAVAEALAAIETKSGTASVALKQTSPRSSRAGKKWLLVASAAVGLLLAGLWAGGVFRLKTKEGTIVLENLPADTRILVDGASAKINYAPDGQWLEVQVAPGKRQLLIQAAGFEAVTTDVTLRAGERKPIRIRLEPPPAKHDTSKPPPDREQPQPAARDYDPLATGRWLPVLTAPGPMVERRNASVADGRIEVQDGHAYDKSIWAADVIVRAKVQKRSGQHVMLTLRDVKGVYYSAFYHYDGAEFLGVGMRGFRFRYGVKQYFQATAGVKEEEFFELAFAAVGDTLTVYVNGRRIGTIRDTVISHAGGVAVHTTKGTGVFQDVEVMILDKPPGAP
ncbi:MAG: protein kinase domain-containing protein [Gemmataceae bacterium]